MQTHRLPTYVPDWTTDDLRRALADTRSVAGPASVAVRLLERELRRRVELGLAPPDTLRRAGVAEHEEASP